MKPMSTRPPLEIPKDWLDAEEEFAKLHPGVDPWLLISPEGWRRLQAARSAAPPLEGPLQAEPDP